MSAFKRAQRPPAHRYAAQESRTSVYILIYTVNDPTLQIPPPPKTKKLVDICSREKNIFTKIVL